MQPTPMGDRATPEAGPISNRDRRARERKIWRSAFLLSAVFHLLLFLIGPSAGDPESPFAAAGPRERDDRAAEGAMRTVALSSAPADPAIPPVLPMPDVELPEPEEVEIEPAPELEVEEPDVPEPGVGATTGTDPEDTGDPGIPGATGRGDAGTTEEGRFRVVPPSPRGMIIPPTNSRMRGSQIQVWVFVNEQGRVVADSTRLDPATSDRRFNRQLMEEAAQWVFEPARQDGTPVPAWFPYTISM
jgi:hypothetical protein